MMTRHLTTREQRIVAFYAARRKAFYESLEETEIDDGFVLVPPSVNESKYETSRRCDDEIAAGITLLVSMGALVLVVAFTVWVTF